MREQIEMAETQRVLFTLFGVPFTATSDSWRFVPPKLVIGVFVAWVTQMSEPVAAWLAWGLIYGVLLLGVLFLHILGHILISKLVSPPMTEARITPMLIQTRYDDDTLDTPGTTHLIRSLGGPLMTLLIGLLAFLAWRISDNQAAGYFAAANFVILFIVLLPLPTVDGEVIWREIGRLRRC
jgi:hypothetical protein